MILESAKDASRQGMWGAIAVAAITGLAVLEELPTLKPLVDPPLVVPQILLFLAIEYGMFRFSKAAAIAGLVCFLASSLYALARFIAQSGSFRFTLLLASALILAFVNGIRGTFAYHRLLKANGGVIPPRLLSDRL